MRTWSKLVNGLKVVLGRAIKNFLGLFVGFGLGQKRSSFRLARLLPKPKTRSSRILSELTPVFFWFSGSASSWVSWFLRREGLAAPGGSPFPAPSLALLRPEPLLPAVLGASPVQMSSFGFSLVRPPGGLEAPSLGEGFAAPGVSPALLAPSPAVPGAFSVWFSFSRGGSSYLKVVPSRVTASKPFGFPPSLAQVSLPPVVPVDSLLAQVSPPLLCNPDSASLAVSQLTTPPSFGATDLGEKLRSSFLVVSKPFQSYIKKARVLREGVSLKWNDVLLSDFLKASKMVADLAVNKVSVAEPLAKKVANPPVKTGNLRKGFLNPRPVMLATPASPRKVFDVGMVEPSSPPRGCSISSPVEGNGFSQSRNWQIGFDHNGEIVVWEEDIDLWDVSPLDWASEGAFGDEALAIRDAMEEEFQHDKMISRQKSKGKRELLNLHSSINYGDAKSSTRCRK
jgi:hypothetical protein